MTTTFSPLDLLMVIWVAIVAAWWTVSTVQAALAWITERHSGTELAPDWTPVPEGARVTFCVTVDFDGESLPQVQYVPVLGEPEREW